MAEGGSGFEMKPHLGTYDSFLSFFKWGTLICAIVALIVVLIIAS